MTDSVVWQDTVDDGVWDVRVLRTSGDGYRGTLVVTHAESGTMMHAESVGLSYGAIFGPYVADVAEWQDTCIQVIDFFNALAGKAVLP